ncbi:hypothetical protein L1887_35751 [Cichorium endivia]|nr:hypothetical protein L1887_35751 [Cichorium endivia]
MMTTIDQISAVLLEEIFVLLDAKSISKSRVISNSGVPSFQEAHLLRFYRHIFWLRSTLYEFIVGYGFGCDHRTGAFKAHCIGYWKKHVSGCLNLFAGRVMVAIYDLSKETRRIILQPYEDMTLVSFRGIVVNKKVLHWLMITEPGSIVRIVSFNPEDEIFGEVGWRIAMKRLPPNDVPNVVPPTTETTPSPPPSPQPQITIIIHDPLQTIRTFTRKQRYQVGQDDCDDADDDEDLRAKDPSSLAEYIFKLYLINQLTWKRPIALLNHHSLLDNHFLESITSSTITDEADCSLSLVPIVVCTDCKGDNDLLNNDCRFDCRFVGNNSPPIAGSWARFVDRLARIRSDKRLKSENWNLTKDSNQKCCLSVIND